MTTKLKILPSGDIRIEFRGNGVGGTWIDRYTEFVSTHAFVSFTIESLLAVNVYPVFIPFYFPKEMVYDN